MVCFNARGNYIRKIAKKKKKKKKGKNSSTEKKAKVISHIVKYLQVETETMKSE